MMKKVLLLALALVLPTTSLAENITVGTWQVTGGTNLRYSSSSTKIDSTGEKIKDTTFAVETSVAYYLTPMVGLGLELSYDDSTTKFPDGSKTDSTSTMIGPKLVLDVPVAPQVAIFGDVVVGYAKADVEGFAFDGYGGSVAGGVKYFFTKNVSGDVGLQYSLAKLEGTVNGGNEKISIGDFRFGVALSVYFNNGAAH